MRRSVAIAVMIGSALFAPLAAHAVCVKPWAAWKVATPTTAQLDEMLADSDCSDDLLAFTKREHNEENILFLRAVTARQDKRALYTRYIPSNARSAINISSPTRNALAAVAARGNWARLDFTPAAAEIKALVVRDTLLRYYATKS